MVLLEHLSLHHLALQGLTFRPSLHTQRTPTMHLRHQLYRHDRNLARSLGQLLKYTVALATFQSTCLQRLLPCLPRQRFRLLLRKDYLLTPLSPEAQSLIGLCAYSTADILPPLSDHWEMSLNA